MNGWTPFQSWWHHTIYCSCWLCQIPKLKVQLLGMRYPNMYLWECLTFLILDCLMSLLSFFLLDDVLEPFPSIKAVEVLLLGIVSTCDGIISSDYTEWFKCDLPSFPYNLDIILAPFPVLISQFSVSL